MAHSAAQRKIIARIAATKRHNPGDTERIAEAYGELKTLTLAERIAEYVASAPLPTPEQRDRLIGLLRAPEGAVTDV